MRFLLDNNLSPKLAVALSRAGHDALHVRDIGLAGASDETIIGRARADERVLISADSDFGTLLARSNASQPSFLLLRRANGRRALDQAAVILDNLEVLAEDLAAGAVVVLGDATVRIRRLPMNPPV